MLQVVGRDERPSHRVKQKTVWNYRLILAIAVTAAFWFILIWNSLAIVHFVHLHLLVSVVLACSATVFSVAYFASRNRKTS